MSVLVKAVAAYLLGLAVFCVLCLRGAVEEYPELGDDPLRDWDDAFQRELADVKP